ncbi:hypothetical protein H7X65_01595 [Candidatus Parcubacteria bacterium]|nr:hypothetical protein [Candidatus Parcubacteria bacterium]
MLTLFPDPAEIIRRFLWDLFFFAGGIFMALYIFKDAQMFAEKFYWLGLAIIFSILETIVWIFRQWLRGEGEE